jgi:hypothetical protein
MFVYCFITNLRFFGQKTAFYEGKYIKLENNRRNRYYY